VPPTSAPSDQEVLERFPGTWVDRDSIEFFRGLLERRLLINRCQDCERWYQPPWPSCPACWSANVTPADVSGAGVLHSFTVPRFGAPAPVVALAVVDLHEQDDLRASGAIVNCAADELRIGMPVELTWLERVGRPVPAFQPRESR
jgi:uncharacterized OB-fold protein